MKEKTGRTVKSCTKKKDLAVGVLLLEANTWPAGICVFFVCSVWNDSRKFRKKDFVKRVFVFSCVRAELVSRSMGRNFRKRERQRKECQQPTELLMR